MSWSPRASLLRDGAAVLASAFPFMELVPDTPPCEPIECGEPAPAAAPRDETPPALIEAAELERLLAQAYADGIARGREEGYADGHVTGYAEGRQEGEAAESARLGASVAAVEQALDEVTAATRPWIDAAEENVTALAVAVARQILDRELRGSTAAFAELVRRALAEFPVDERVRIRLHPADLAAISALPGPGDDSFSVTGGREAAWVADPTVGPGGCLVEGRTRIIDGRVDLALERVYRSLTHTHA
jgi:flagellar assembly protein FliH